MKLINGREIADQIKNRLRVEVKRLPFPPSLQVIILGESKLAQVFLRGKEKACQEVGIDFRCHRQPVAAKQKEVTTLIQTLNSDPQVTGILIQLSFPPQSELGLVLLDQIDPKKDIDCLTSINFGRFATGNPLFVPPTAQAVNQILEKEKIQIKGKNVTVVGAGRVAGLPIALSLLQQGATVTVCHEFTQNLKEHTQKAEILISAAGQPGLIKSSMVKKGAVIIDVGTSWAKNRTAGDVSLKGLEETVSKVTPVPGGIGPVMVACLLKNVVKATRL